ncbi:DNA gyrase inhibitor YacG [Pseudotabrizicola alkalilacus]|uniref:DNA gyrase inhibitor YacG n=1 Tax=Pseudotabrizicola alkalilacus TaxID=2305252 RepID=A0A411Z736_9RHOB|nr:DNA gyrase inhibitor YacG [Pseudotabrizicola alkalilacus]RGP38920.1 DNA gyrase inhibitor YacG [Pseudotabrizicola alkalilacus]
MSCPICKKDTDPKYRPFCSRRCADVDLGRWLTESYAIPAPEGEEETPPELDDEDRKPRH